MSASADYNTAITEDFAPPSDWVPGQVIKKEVGVVNTGNVDAFVRTWLEGEMIFLGKGTGENIPANANKITITSESTSPKTSELAKDLQDAGLTAYNSDTNTIYYRVLDKTAKLNPNGNATDLDDVVSRQSGGYLAYCPANAEYQFTANAVTGSSPVTYKATVAGTGSEANTQYIPAGTHGIGIDSESFKPTTTGLYLFRRNIDVTTGTAPTNGETGLFEYTGYYYIQDDDTNPTAGGGTYLDLWTLKDADSTAIVSSDLAVLRLDANDATDATKLEDTKEGDLKDAAISDLKLFTATKTVKEQKDLYWMYDETNKVIKVSTGMDEKTAATAGYIQVGSESKYRKPTGVVINIALDNIGADAEKWTAILDKGNAYPQQYTTANDVLGKFYYNNDLEEGNTTSLLVKSVTLDSGVTQNDYIAFDFDLNVKMESVQVTMSPDGVEMDTPVAVSPGAATFGQSGDDKGATGAATIDTNAPKTEITLVTWTATDTTNDTKVTN